MSRRMSSVGTFRTWMDVRLESVMRFKADIGESKYSDRACRPWQFPGRHASSIGSASESSHGLMGSERGRRHPHHRD